MELTLLDGGDRHRLVATRHGDDLHVPEAALEAALGWKLRPEGLCRGDVCIPVRDRAGLVHADGIALEAFAALLGRPLAVDAEETIAALGESAGERAAALETGEAPDFTLPDLDGRMHSLSDHRGKKVLLIAYASW